MMKLHPDWREFIGLLNSHGVEYLLVGAHARAVHGVPRSTGDIDFFVRPSVENARRLMDSLRAFGFGAAGLCEADFELPDQIVQLGIEPYRIVLITGISGVPFEEAWADRVEAMVDGLPMPVISLRAYRRNKAAAGRPKDLGDLDALPG